MITTLVIPTYNEAANLSYVLKRCDGKCDETLVVDGHSSDGTREVAEQHGVRAILDNGKGKGDGLRVALREARGDIVVFMDADGSHDPEDIPMLLAPIQNGYRAIRRQTGIEAGLTEDIFTIEQEMIMKVLQKGGRVSEIPSHEYQSRNARSGIVVWKVAHRYVWCLLKNLV